MHLIVEAERLAFADRDRYIADPDFVPTPAGLLDRSYLEQRRALIDPKRARSDVTAGTPPNTRQGAYGRDRTIEGIGTSHISIVDKDGNAVSMTTTIEQAFGSRIMVRGFLLNNQLTDFAFVPVDDDGRPVANRVEPGKRPRSSMDPTMIFAAGSGDAPPRAPLPARLPRRARHHPVRGQGDRRHDRLGARSASGDRVSSISVRPGTPFSSSPARDGIDLPRR